MHGGDQGSPVSGPDGGVITVVDVPDYPAAIPVGTIIVIKRRQAEVDARVAHNQGLYHVPGNFHTGTGNRRAGVSEVIQIVSGVEGIGLAAPVDVGLNGGRRRRLGGGGGIFQVDGAILYAVTVEQHRRQEGIAIGNAAIAGI